MRREEVLHLSGDITVIGKAIPPRHADEFDRLYGAEVGYSVIGEVQTAALARQAPEAVTLEGDRGDVLEIEDIDGLVTFRTVASVFWEEGRTVRSDEPGGLVRAAASRDGLGTVASVRRARYTLPDEVAAAALKLDELLPETPLDALAGGVVAVGARAAMKRIVDWIDTPAEEGDQKWHHKPKTRGVYRIDPEIRLVPGNRVGTGDLDASGDPWLLLLHGTFSHSEGGFGGLRGDDFTRFARRYGDRMLALEHATLGKTPAQNAVDAAEMLPDGARLHLVSHSRGGLVGEALSLAAADVWPGTDLYERRAHPDHPDVAALRRLREIAKDKDLRVERFARVACPARGTTLASRRLDIYATFLFNLFNLIPGAAETGVAALVKKFLLALLDTRSDPRLVPGIEAMMPESAFVALLASAAAIDDGMAAISGDVMASGILHRLKVFGADLFYREDHDFVVNTRSMAGGIPRAPSRQAFFTGPEVVHFSYFSRERSRRAVLGWLEADTADVEDFAEPGAPPIVSRTSGHPMIPAGTVVIVPDVFGSQLAHGSATPWPAVKPLLGGVEPALGLSRSLDAGDLTGVYEPLRHHLAANFTVEAFPYDWRRSVDQVAEALSARLDSLFHGEEPPTRPVHVLAMGAGALALLRLLASSPAVARDVTAGGGRIVLVSPPLRGSWRIAAMLRGHDELTARLALLDPEGDAAAIGDMLVTFPGLVELLPEGSPFAADVLARGTAARTGLGTGAGVIALFGSRTPTVAGWSADDRRFTTTTEGDGQVTLETATVLREATVLFAPMATGTLITRPYGLSAITNVLLGAPTPGLLVSASRGAAQTATLAPAVHRVDFPSDADLAEAATGIATVTEKAEVSTLRLSVVHGDLTSVDDPVLVGAYDGTPIDGAVGACDRRVDGALATRAALGQLAGAVGTCDVISRTDGSPSTVVIGIGNPGQLTPGELTAGVATAILRLALAYLDAGTTKPLPGFTVASVLIGTGGSALGVPPSLAAIVAGVHRANRYLADAGKDIRAEALKIIEQYEDRAIEATQAAIKLAAERQPEGTALAAERILLDGCNGLPGMPPPEYRTGEWRTIRVAQAPDAVLSDDGLVALSFTSIGRTARAEQRVTLAQRRLIEQFIDEGIREPRTNPQLYNTLYELLVPNHMKGERQGTENVMFVVDEHASTIPLELLGTRASGDEPVPMAVDVPLIRRLETPTFRETVRSAAGSRALVIGEPAGIDPPLPGARKEAERVAAILENRFEVTRLISKGPDDRSVSTTAIMNALFEHDYRIIHIAAHGVFRSPEENGILIGPDLLLTANEIRQMRAAPDLVFLNACHVGSILFRPPPGAGAPPPGEAGSPEGTPAGRPAGAERVGRGDPLTNAPGRMAASIARQLIDDGVRAVVAAAWAVDDEAAAAFAEKFYDELLDKSDLGTAAHEARKEIYQRFEGINTWGAYQIYGPPAMRIHTAGTRAGGEPVETASRKQFRQRLGELSRDAADATGATVGEIERSVAELVASVPRHWRGGDELSKEADILFTLGRYAEAIHRFEAAVRHSGGSTPLRMMEQLANAKAKYAQRLLDGDPGSEEGLSQMSAAEGLIEALVGMGDASSERLAIKGSFWRRRAAVDEDPVGALETACKAYGEAALLYREEHGGYDFYSGLNWVVLAWLVATHSNQSVDLVAMSKVVAECLADADGRPCPDFWTRVAHGDGRLAQALLDQALPERKDDVADTYRAAFAFGASRRQRLSIVEHLEIIRKGLRGTGEQQETALALEALATEVHPDNPQVG